MTSSSNRPSLVTYRNFNLCPHCLSRQKEAVLSRLWEDMPMISRSDGESFHLLLADRPLPYPVEENCVAHASYGHESKTSVCFWYSHVRNAEMTCTCVVILPQMFKTGIRLFREIERVADLLSEELLAFRHLAVMYEVTKDSLVELSY